ncbi:hypothetical protein DPMN_147957 [Dreissena polymorpha]|uniref:Serine-threonine/tyrosine-protein kinase catalytic domain-containing protein n=1 Tax=Dreissena polymorpha TaxID=45954 RepID=A0A9D4F8N8_DREPO|nr:hypothetical protein DPMN_147957 [Dreissena polymorpha]
MLLPQPIVCPREIYDMMVECWNRSDCERPTFKDIHMFLLRKNMGYNPKDEKLNQLKFQCVSYGEHIQKFNCDS